MTSDQTSTGPVQAPPSRFSIAGKLVAVVAAALVLQLAVALLAERAGASPWASSAAGFAVALAFSTWSVAAATRPLRRTLASLADGIRSFQDRDFSMRLAAGRDDELGELLRLYNRVGELLQEERGHLRQRELLLQSALDRSPVAILLVGPLDRVTFANVEARRLFLGGGRLVGLGFTEIAEHCPAEMRQVLESGSDGLFSVEADGELETYHLSQRDFRLNRRPHRLLLLRRMTTELARREAEIWKKVIRIISHELNNSLAPISSLAHSGLLVARSGERLERLDSIHAAIRERIDHLTGFLEGYARFARLPQPHVRSVDWEEWLAGPRRLYRFEIAGRLPTAPGVFDPTQLEQVLINLLKNAHEASDDGGPVEVRVGMPADGSARIEVLDRGRGMEPDVMRRALLPFYSTKPSGGGVGLPLCREIVEAHGGTLRIQGRTGGGTAVTIRLPPAGS